MKIDVKKLVIISFLFVLLISVLGVWDASITQPDLIFASIILLLVLVPELKDFNFWGMRGTSNTEINAPRDADAISDNIQAPSRDVVYEAEQNTKPQLMDTDTGNFLTLFAEIERLLNVVALALYPDQLKDKAKHGIITKVLEKEGFITASGMQQLTAMRQIRNKLVHGMRHELSEEIISQGVELASNFYQELNDWFEQQDSNKST